MGNFMSLSKKKSIYSALCCAFVGGTQALQGKKCKEGALLPCRDIIVVLPQRQGCASTLLPQSYTLFFEWVSYGFGGLNVDFISLWDNWVNICYRTIILFLEHIVLFIEKRNGPTNPTIANKYILLIAVVSFF